MSSNQKKGKIIIVEGADFVGKTSAIKYIEEYMRNFIDPQVLVAREPGGTQVAELIRDTIFAARKLENEKSGTKYRGMLFFASRLALLEETILPHLAKGHHVILDRSWITTFVYQGLNDGNLDLVKDLYDAMMKTTGLTEDQFVPICITASKDLIQERLAASAPEDQNSYDPKTEEDIIWQLGRYAEVASHFKMHMVENSTTLEELQEKVVDIIDDNFTEEVDAAVDKISTRMIAGMDRAKWRQEVGLTTATYTAGQNHIRLYSFAGPDFEPREIATEPFEGVEIPFPIAMSLLTPPGVEDVTFVFTPENSYVTFRHANEDVGITICDFSYDPNTDAVVSVEGCEQYAIITVAHYFKAEVTKYSVAFSEYYQGHLPASTIKATLLDSLTD